MSEQSKETIIANGTEFDGSIKSECGILLSGKVKGEVEAPSLTVNKSGVIDGTVQVLELHSEGEVSGEIDADTIVLAGKVSDNTVIRANSLKVELGQPNSGYQVTFGNCQLKVGKPKTMSEKKPETNDTAMSSPSKDGSDLEVVESTLKSGL